MYTLTDPAKKNYFEGALEPALKYFAQKEEDKLKSDSLEGSIAAANESEMFDSDFAAYEQMAKQLRDTLPEAMKSDVEMKAWEARLAQANAYLESSKAYYTKNYAIYDQNMNASQGANSAELESRGLRDAHSASDYDKEMLMLNNRNMFTITVDENGQFVMNDGTGINDHFDEEHFRQDLVATDIRQPDTYWPKHGTTDMPASQEDLETKIYSGIVNDSLEKINAERWYKNDRGMDPTVELNEDQREDAYRKYAKAAAEDAWRAEEERQNNQSSNTATGVVLESAEDPSVSSGATIYTVTPAGWTPSGFVVDEKIEVQESSVVVPMAQTGEFSMNINQFSDEVKFSQDGGTIEFDDPTHGRVTNYRHGLEPGQAITLARSPNRFSVADDDPNALRLYFDMGPNYPAPRERHIQIRKGTPDWRLLEQQLGEEFINDLFDNLAAGL
jgi:hypothetical protein